MIRLINDVNGFTDRNTTNRSYITYEKYPEQNTEFIGKWTVIRYRAETKEFTGIYRYYDRHREVCKRPDGKFVYKVNGLPVPETDSFGHPIIIESNFVPPQINNRYRIMEEDAPEDYDIDNSGRQTFFQILRYDLEEPFKVILRSFYNEIIVMSKDEFEDIYDLEKSKWLKSVIAAAEKKGMTYISPNTTTDSSLFFEKLANEKINIFPIQDSQIYGRACYTEYYSDLFGTTSGFNRMNKYETVDDDKNTITFVEGYTYRYEDGTTVTLDPVTVESLGKNRFKFTEKMRKQMLMMHSTLRGMPDVIMRSFAQYYNLHSKSYMDTPRRAFHPAIVVRCDLRSSQPQTVVMEFVDTTHVRFICQDEANFFYDTVTSQTSKRVSIASLLQGRYIVGQEEPEELLTEEAGA